VAVLVLAERPFLAAVGVAQAGQKQLFLHIL
jgi:hypothetical protein